MESAATKLFQNQAAAVARRVVSTPTIHPAGVTYEGVLKCIPTSPPELLPLLNPAATQPHKKFASSREAAHAGDALERFFRRERFFYDLAFKGMTGLAAKPPETEVMRLALGFGQRGDDPRVCGTAAQPIVRAAFGLALHETVMAWTPKSKRKAFTITLIKSQWRRSRTTPMMNIENMTQTVKEALDDIGFEGFFIIEVQGMRSQEKDLHFHVHGIITSKRKGALSEEEARARLTKRFPRVDGAKGVIIKPCKNDADIEHFLMYSAKSPDKIKRIYTDGSVGSQQRVREGRKGYSSAFALDILALRSRLPLPSLIIAHGKQFQRMKAAILARTDTRLKVWGVTRKKTDPKRTIDVWRRIRDRNAPKNGFGLPAR